MAISLGQKLPNAEVIVVTTPQQAAAEVAERAGTMASMMNQRVIGVIENMAYLEVTCPDCGEPHRVEVFGSGGGADVAATLSTRLGYPVPLLAQVPLDPALRAGATTAYRSTRRSDSAGRGGADRDRGGARRRGRGLVGRQLGLRPDRPLSVAATRVAAELGRPRRRRGERPGDSRVGVRRRIGPGRPG